MHVWPSSQVSRELSAGNQATAFSPSVHHSHWGLIVPGPLQACHPQNLQLVPPHTVQPAPRSHVPALRSPCKAHSLQTFPTVGIEVTDREGRGRENAGGNRATCAAGGRRGGGSGGGSQVTCTKPAATQHACHPADHHQKHRVAAAAAPTVSCLPPVATASSSRKSDLQAGRRGQLPVNSGEPQIYCTLCCAQNRRRQAKTATLLGSPQHTHPMHAPKSSSSQPLSAAQRCWVTTAPTGTAAVAKPSENSQRSGVGESRALASARSSPSMQHPQASKSPRLGHQEWGQLLGAAGGRNPIRHRTVWGRGERGEHQAVTSPQLCWTANLSPLLQTMPHHQLISGGHPRGRKARQAGLTSEHGRHPCR